MISLAKERFHLRASGEMIVSRLIASLGLATSVTVLSIYLKEVGFSDSNIGFIWAGTSLLVVTLSPLIPILLERFNVLRVYVSSLVILAITLSAMGFTAHVLLAVILFFLIEVCVSVFGNSASIVFKDVSGSRTKFRKAQGLASSLMNFGWVVGPLIGGLVLVLYDVRTTLVVGGTFILLSALVVILKPIKLKAKYRTKIDSSWLENVHYYFARKNLVLAYLQRFGVTAWWAYIWTFVPLFMLNDGYSAGTIGFALALTQVPLFLFEFRTVDFIPKLGYRKIFFSSYIFMTFVILTTLLTTNHAIVIGLLVFASAALCFLEPITEIYFYDQVSSIEEERTEPIYHTANSTGSIVIRLFASLALAISGVNASYAVLAVLMLVIAVSALKIKPSR